MRRHEDAGVRDALAPPADPATESTQGRRSIDREEKAMSLLRRGPRSIPRAARRLWSLITDLRGQWMGQAAVTSARPPGASIADWYGLQ